MKTTVRSIYSLQLLRENMGLIAGEAGLDREVTSVSVMEVPDFADANLSQGLFVLTTLYNFSNDENEMVEMIKKLSINRASGIVIKINRFIDSIPTRVIEEADRHHLPMFCTQKLFFSNIISIITSEIINNEFNKIKTANEQYQEIFFALLNGEKINNFANKIGKRLGYSCACVSERGQVLAQYFRDKVDRGKIKHKNYEEILDKIQQSVVRRLKTTSMLRFDDCYVFLCRVKEKMLGYFIVWNTDELTEYEMLLSQQMTNFLSMKFMEEYVVWAEQRRRISTILDEILFGQNNKLEVIKERLYLLGFKENKAYRVLLFAVSEKKINRMKFGIDLFLNNIQIQFPGSVAYFIMEGLVMIYPTSEDYAAHSGGNKKIKAQIGDVITGMQLNCKVGCSIKQNDLRKIPECLNQAKQALNYGRVFETQESVYCYENYSEISTVSYLIGTSGEDELYRTIINPIQEYDRGYNQQLWLTLEECLSNNTLESAAKALHIHSSTLRYRLQNIYNITGHDYFSNIGRYVLNTAYILYKITR